MERFASLAYAPFETRRLLRQRLGAALQDDRPMPPPPPDQAIDDQAYLAFMLDLRIEYDCDVALAKAAYDQLAASSGEPAFEKLAGEGWLRAVWGRLSATMEVARRADPIARPGLAAMLASRHGRRHVLSETMRNRADVAALIEGLGREARLPADVRCVTPSWVAARLWEARDGEAPVEDALRLWADRWTAMRQPDVVPGRAWCARVALSRCRKTLGEQIAHRA